MAGFRKLKGPARTPMYTVDSRKIGYMQGEWFVDCEGRKVARILRYKVELPAATSSLSGSHVVIPEERYEG